MASRNDDLAKIHIAKKALAMDGDSYAGMLTRVVGRPLASSKDLTATELKKLLQEMARLGWNPTKKPATAPTYKHKTSRYLAALWGDLYRSGHVRDRSKGAFHAWVKSQTGKDHPDWLETSERARLIEALKAWGKRPKETDHDN